LVLEYQRTGNEDVFLAIYGPRKRTFTHLANRFHYITEDIKSEMHLVFMKAIVGFKPNCRSFNTYFYTSALNHIRNMIKSKSRNKRTLSDGTDPHDSFLYLDDSIDIDGGSTYHDIISTEGENDRMDVISLIEYVGERSWLLLDIVMDMMGSGKPPLKRKVYESIVPVDGGGSIHDIIGRDTGLSISCYRVVETDFVGEEMRYVIDVSRQKAYDVIVEMVSHFSKDATVTVVV